MSSHRAKRASFPRDPSSSLPPFRDHATVKLQKLLNQGGGTEQGRAAAIEAALYERYGHSLSTPSPDYNSHLRTLLYNMPRNNWLLSRVRAGELTAEEVAGLSSEDMLPREEREKQQEVVRKAFDLQRLDHDKAPQLAPIEDSVGPHCPFCGSKHVGTLRRNAITDVEESMLESSCESCGRTWVAQEQAVGEGW